MVYFPEDAGSLYSNLLVWGYCLMDLLNLAVQSPVAVAQSLVVLARLAHSLVARLALVPVVRNLVLVALAVQRPVVVLALSLVALVALALVAQSPALALVVHLVPVPVVRNLVALALAVRNRLVVALAVRSPVLAVRSPVALVALARSTFHNNPMPSPA